ncbi:DUF7447 family protein [Arthrobacter tecti]
MADLYIDVEELTSATLRSANQARPADEVVHEVARYTEEAGWKSPTEWTAYRQRFAGMLQDVMNAQTPAEGLASRDAALAYASDVLGVRHGYRDEPVEPPIGLQRFSSVSQMRAAVIGSGSEFFSADTMRYWGTKLHGGIVGGHYFITSDWANFEKTARTYKVRWFTQREPHLMMIGHNAGPFETLADAQEAARRLADTVSVKVPA